MASYNKRISDWSCYVSLRFQPGFGLHNHAAAVSAVRIVCIGFLSQAHRLDKPGAAAPMKDYQTRLEALCKDAAECALISDLATTPQKRVSWASLAAHLSTLAAEVERAMGRSK